MLAEKLFARLSQLLDVAVTRANDVWPRFNANGSVDQLDAPSTREALNSLSIFNVMDYGAVHDGVTDDTAAINTALAACYAARGGIPYFPNGHYWCPGAFGSANSILLIPASLATAYPYNPILIVLLGESRGTLDPDTDAYDGGVVIDCTGAPSGSGTLPAILAARPYLQTVFNSTGCNLCDTQVAMECITFLSPPNPNFGGVQLANCPRVNIGDEVSIRVKWSASGIPPFGGWPAFGPVRPTNGNAIGLLLPQNLANNEIIVGSASISGWNQGVVGYEHAHFRKTQIAYCDYGLNLNGSGAHLISGDVSIENCIRPIFAGAGDVPIDLSVQFESGTTDASPGAWWVTTAHMTTTGGWKFLGKIAYENAIAGGATYAPITTSGGPFDKLITIDLPLASVVVAKLNGNTITSGTGSLTLSTFALTATASGNVVVQDGALGAPSSGTLTNATGLPISTGVSGLGTGAATALGLGTTIGGNGSSDSGKLPIYDGFGGLSLSAQLVIQQGSYGVTITPSTFTATRSLQIPDNSGVFITTGNLSDITGLPALFATQSAADPHAGTFSQIACTNGSATLSLSLNGFITGNNSLYLYAQAGHVTVYGNEFRLGTSEDLVITRPAADVWWQTRSSNEQEFRLGPSGSYASIASNAGTLVVSNPLSVNSATIAGTFATSDSSTYPNIAAFLAPNTPTGGAGTGCFLNFGVASTSGNSAVFQFTYMGSGSASNFGSLGIYGSASILSIFASGVGIGTGATIPPTNGLTVAGQINALRFSGIGAAISGNFTATGAVSTTFTVTIGVTMANTSYEVLTEGSNALSAAVHYVNNKTTTTFDVVYLAGLTGAVAFDWSVFP